MSSARAAARGAGRRRFVAGEDGAAVEGRASWFQAKHPIFRFVLIFAVLMGGFYVLTMMTFIREGPWTWYLEVNADFSGAILRLLGSDVMVAGNAITSSRGSLSIRAGCDATHPSALLVSGILAYPTSIWKKLPGMVVGTLLLLSINLIRIVSLFYIQIYFPRAFEIMHIEVWQALFIFLAIAFWAIWVQQAERGERARLDVPA